MMPNVPTKTRGARSTADRTGSSHMARERSEYKLQRRCCSIEEVAEKECR